MKQLVRKVTKALAYAAAAVVILLAIALGLFRLFLPRLPEYQEDIKVWASDAIGMEVQFTGMDARWRLSGPEVEFYDAQLVSRETGRTVIAAEAVSVGIELTRFVTDRKAVVDRIAVRESRLTVQQREDGQWWIQGSPPDELLPARPDGGEGVGSIEIAGEDLSVVLLQAGARRPHRFRIPNLLISRDEARLAIDAAVELPAELGESLAVSATQLVANGDEKRPWTVGVDAQNLKLAGISTLHASELAQFEGGRGDLQLSVALLDGRASKATAEVDFKNVRAAGAPPFSFAGRFELLNDPDGWLVAADDFKLDTVNGTWPSTDLRAEAGTNADGEMSSLDLRMSYARLDDAIVFRPWLEAERRQQLDAYDPNGVVRNLALSLSEVDSDTPRFNVAVELDRVGVASVGDFPGVRGFSGQLRSDRTGGLFEIASAELSVSLPKYLSEPVMLDEFTGTLIWRRSDQRTTLLSDNIVFGNDDFAFETSVEISLPDGSKKPVVDLVSTWSINDIAEARKYIPYIPRIPRTSEWFQEGLLAGRIPQGTISLNGPLEQWPFDDGEGHFRVTADLRDARIKYQRRWPAADIESAEIAIDNMRLYTEKNHIVNAGNEVRNALIEIGDFRNPVLRISFESAGPLDTVRRLLAQSPVGIDVFKGRMERISIEGSGSYALDMTVPIRNWRDFDFTTRVQTDAAALKLEGFPAALTDVSGVVTIGRNDISSEDLTGTLLGGTVDIDLQPAPESMPGYRILANATGRVTADALVTELGIPYDDAIAGATDFSARLLFARGKQEEPQPFVAKVQSDLSGLEIALPEPFYKAAAESYPLQAGAELAPGAEALVITGDAENRLSWLLDFAKGDGSWDLDRGLVAFGGEVARRAETRGLHFTGHADTVMLQAWFDRAGGSNAETKPGSRVVDRIRSVDMTIGSLHLLGQHIRDHHVRLDRSAEEWLVQFDGPEIVGSAAVPYDFKAGRPLVIDMERLVLPGDDDTGDVVGQDKEHAYTDPRALPPITINAGEFAIGTRHLGTLRATLEKTAAGLETSDLRTDDKTFEIAAEGRWVVDESDPTGSHSYLAGTMKSKDVEKTMARLDYEPGIDSDEFTAKFDLNWSGGPRDDFRDTLNGEVTVRVGTGQLNDVEPGAGRMFGLMSVVALPRRLSLDFRDVFNKGFGFDEIRGRFRLENGQTYTCNLSLDGPAAQIGIVGRTGLVDRDYDQTAVVSANFGNALPVVGAALGGPGVAAVVLIFSQIFKKPLSEVGQVYYGISGSWDDPAVESVSGEAFAEQGVRAGCIDETE